MINLDSLTIKAFIKENLAFFTNAKIQKIQMPSKREFLLTLRNNAESKKLCVSILPQYAHLCFVSKENESKRNIKIPKQPPMFCMQLRKHLESGRIKAISQIEYERIIEILVENYNELGEKITLCLTFELMGKHSNAILYNQDSGIILGCAHNISEEKSSKRELYGGLTYTLPPKQFKQDITKTTPDTFLHTLDTKDTPIEDIIPQEFYYISKALAREVYNFEQNKIMLYKELYTLVNLESIAPSITTTKSEFSIYAKDKTMYESEKSVSEMIDNYFSFHINKQLLNEKKQKLTILLNRKLVKINKLEEKQQSQSDKIKNAVQYKNKADLLMCNLNIQPNSAKIITLNDLETNAPVEIEIDPQKTLIENANKYYKLYNKFKTASNIAQTMLEKTLVEKDEIQELLFNLEISESIEDLEQIENEITPAKIPEKNKEINIDCRIIDEFRVFIGKNSKQNEYILKQIAKPTDIWFHTLNIPSAHVLLKTDDNKTPKDTTILKIAQLTKEYSKAKDTLKAPVIYTLRKYVKKPPNTPAGFVIYREEKEIMV